MFCAEKLVVVITSEFNLLVDNVPVVILSASIPVTFIWLAVNVPVYIPVPYPITITELGGISDGSMTMDCGITTEFSLATSSQITGIVIDTDGASTTSFTDATVPARGKIKCLITEIGSGTSTYPYITYTIDD